MLGERLTNLGNVLIIGIISLDYFFSQSPTEAPDGETLNFEIQYIRFFVIAEVSPASASSRPLGHSYELEEH